MYKEAAIRDPKSNAPPTSQTTGSGKRVDSLSVTGSMLYVREEIVSAKGNGTRFDELDVDFKQRGGIRDNASKAGSLYVEVQYCGCTGMGLNE